MLRIGGWVMLDMKRRIWNSKKVESGKTGDVEETKD
jgi:hypothetical protein